MDMDRAPPATTAKQSDLSTPNTRITRRSVLLRIRMPNVIIINATTTKEEEKKRKINSSKNTTTKGEGAGPSDKLNTLAGSRSAAGAGSLSRRRRRRPRRRWRPTRRRGGRRRRRWRGWWARPWTGRGTGPSSTAPAASSCRGWGPWPRESGQGPRARGQVRRAPAPGEA
ncbi:hypothetical protein D1007_01512 [Hordeum vulgare]|nr:hypothetical protein D1007_01512 [Hordeum vulgare]